MYQHDALNRLAKTTDANAGITQHGYDDAKGQKTEEAATCGEAQAPST